MHDRSAALAALRSWPDVRARADVLQMSEEWVRKQVQAPTVPYIRLGRRVRFSAADIAAIIEAAERPVLRRSRIARTKL